MQPTRTVTKFLVVLGMLSVNSYSFAQTIAEGVVRRIDLDNNKITIRHGEIKSLDMPPMTMVFIAKQPELLKSLQPGDDVEFEAFEANGQFSIGKIKKK